MSNYVFKTVVRDTDAEPTYTFAEVEYGKIKNIHKHWVPLEEFISFFDPKCLFIDITGVLVDGEEPTIGDCVSMTDGVYSINHIKTVMTVNGIKKYQTEKLKLIRDQKELAPIDYAGVKYDADKDALMRMDKAKGSLTRNNIPNIDWTLYDNTHRDTTVEDFNNIEDILATRSGMLHARYGELKTYIEALDDKYSELITYIDWNWDITCDLDAKLAELTSTENK